MDVKIETKCPRCEKKTERTVPLGEAQELQTNQERKTEKFELLLGDLHNLFNEYSEIIPAAITMFKNEKGELELSYFGTGNLCAAPDAKRNKGCASRVRTLIDEMYNVSKKPPKKKKKKATEPKEKDEETK